MVKIVLIVYLLVVIANIRASKKIICYYDTKTQFQPHEVNPYLCTHLIVSYASISNGLLKEIDKSYISSLFFRGLYERCTDLKKRNPKLKVFLALDGNLNF